MDVNFKVAESRKLRVVSLRCPSGTYRHREMDGTHMKKEEDGKKEKTEEEVVHLRREIGLLPAVSFIIGTVVGSGIFIAPKGVLINSGSVGLSLLVWALCGVLSMFGKMLDGVIYLCCLIVHLLLELNCDIVSYSLTVCVWYSV